MTWERDEDDMSGSENERYVRREDALAARDNWFRQTERKPKHRKFLTEAERERRKRHVRKAGEAK